MSDEARGEEAAGRSLSLREILLQLALAASVWLAFEQVTRYEFVRFDDDEYVTGNPVVATGLNAQSARWALGATAVNNWHPLTWLSHMLDVELYGLDASGHHLTNLLLHLLNAALLLHLLCRTTGSLWPSAFVAALFALHPLRVEVVAWVSERKELLSTLFGLLSLLAYTAYARSSRRAPYTLALACFALALCAKPMLVTLPFLLLLLDYWPLARLRSLRAAPGLLLEKLPFLGLSLVVSCITLLAQEASEQPLAHAPLHLRMANAGMSVVRYIGKLAWPVDLSVHYTHPNFPGGTPWEASEIALAAALLLALSLVVLRRGACRYAQVGWLWYLGALVPVLGLVQVGRQAMADRYTYFPMIGLGILIAWTAKAMLSQLSRYRLAAGRAVFALALATLCMLLIRTRQQVLYWSDSLTLFSHALELSPEDPLMNYNLGTVLAGAGRTDEAIAAQRRALAAKPDYAQAYNNLGVALRAKGEIGEAIRAYEQALAIVPSADAAFNLGNALRAQDRADDATRRYQQALGIDPKHAGSHYRLGRVREARGALEDAAHHYRAAVESDPGLVRAHYQLATLELKRGRLADADRHYRAVLQWEPEHVDALSNLGIVLASLGRVSEAIQSYRQILRLRPDHADALNNLGVLLASQGKLDQAIRHYRHALQAKPDHPDARRNLAEALERLSPGGPSG